MSDTKNQEAYLKRSQILEQIGEQERASEDTKRVLRMNQVHPTMVREAISRLMRVGDMNQKDVVISPAVLSLDPDDKLWLANTFDRSLDDVRLAVTLLEPLLDASELSESDLLSTRYDLGMSYMRLGRYLEAAGMFRSEGENITDLDIPDAFNFAMAMWGQTGTVQEEIFQHVVELNRSGPLEETPNYLQCMAIAYWAVGDDNSALEFLEQARRALVAFEVEKSSAAGATRGR